MAVSSAAGNQAGAWRSWLERLRSRWEEGIRHKVTPLGGMMLALLFATGILAFSTSQNVFFLLFSLLAASILISSFVNRLMLAGLEVRVELPEHVCAGQRTMGEIVLENTKDWVTTYGLEVRAGQGPAKAVPVLKKLERVSWWPGYEKRGMAPPLQLELTTRFPFGFSVRRVRVQVEVQQLILPPVGQDDGFAEILEDLRGKAEAAARLSGGDFSHLRDYVPGDSLRRIAWPATARRQTPIVREHEEEGEGRLVLGLDRGSPDFERLVHLASYLTWSLARNGTHFAFLGEEIMDVREETDAYRVLEWLARVEAEEGAEVAKDDRAVWLSWRDLQ